MDATVTSLIIYPEHGGPGQELASVEITPTGPEGNRAKKHAVHLVSATDYVETYPRANIVLDIAADRLVSLVGRVIRIGEATLEVTRAPQQCAGVYAAVIEPGEVELGNALLVADA